MLKFSAYFVLVINGNQINGFHLFWDTLYKMELNCKHNCTHNITKLIDHA